MDKRSEQKGGQEPQAEEKTAAAWSEEHPPTTLNLKPLAEAYTGITPQYHALSTPADYLQLLDYLPRTTQGPALEKKPKDIALYLDWTQERPALPQIKTLGLAYDDREAFYAELPEEENNKREYLALWKPFFECTARRLVVTQSKELVLALKAYGIDLQGPFLDVSIVHYLHNPETRHDLEALSSHWLKAEDWPSLGETSATSTPSSGWVVAQRAAQLIALAPRLIGLLATGKLQRIYDELDHPLIEVLTRMEEAGVRVDAQALAELSARYARESETLAQDIHRLAGETFNIASPKQLGVLLFEKLALDKAPKKTKTGAYATGENILQKLVSVHPIVEKVMAYREYQKLRNTYLDALPAFISPKDHRIHTQYRQDVAATGRLSSNHPNLQNIPIRTPKGQPIRQAFCAEKGHVLLSVDYSQVELRVLADMAGDQAMRTAFSQGEDIHRSMAAYIYDISPEAVSKEQRSTAKAANFGIIYGISAFGLSEQLQRPQKEAKALITTYLERFPAIARFIETQKAYAREKGFVETYWGRRRYLPEIHSRNATMRAFAERNAVNAPIQGTAADIIKKAMLFIDQWLKQKAMQARIILHIHDELLIEAPHKEVEALYERVPVLMREASPLQTPMEVAVGHGDNWLQAHG